MGWMIVLHLTGQCVRVCTADHGHWAAAAISQQKKKNSSMMIIMIIAAWCPNLQQRCIRDAG